jgi:hypothetical protein
MLFDQATDSQMEAARIFGGATMVAFLGARMFRLQARKARMVIASLYIAGVLGFVVYVVL